MWIALSVGVDTPYAEIVGQMVLIGLGLGATTAPATESIMGSLSAGKAGVGSAVNDTTRELGGTLGVAIIGSVFSSLYVNALEDGDSVVEQLPPETQELTKDSVGAARTVAGQLGANAQPYLDQVNDAFLGGLSVGCLVAAGVAAAGAVFASRFLRPPAPHDGAWSGRHNGLRTGRERIRAAAGGIEWERGRESAAQVPDLPPRTLPCRT